MGRNLPGADNFKAISVGPPFLGARPRFWPAYRIAGGGLSVREYGEFLTGALRGPAALSEMKENTAMMPPTQILFINRAELVIA
ncbi:MAG TPA: hypothetical protein VN633_08515 [Bryobacteraceae bacterium]|nr:hypothetical protein [Bryobacteraceae bacterium]